MRALALLTTLCAVTKAWAPDNGQRPTFDAGKESDEEKGGHGVPRTPHPQTVRGRSLNERAHRLGYANLEDMLDSLYESSELPFDKAHSLERDEKPAVPPVNFAPSSASSSPSSLLPSPKSAPKRRSLLRVSSSSPDVVEGRLSSSEKEGA